MNQSETKPNPAVPSIPNVLGFGVALLSAMLLVSPTVQDPDAYLAKVGFTVLLFVIAIQDLKTRTVSLAITAAWMLAAIARAVVQQDLMFIPFWIGIFLLWSLHIYGGGDAKLLMGLFGLYPDLRLLWITSAVLLTVGVPVLILKYARTSPRLIVSGLAARLASGALLPSDEELNRGVPFAFAYCLAGGIYLWLLH